MFSGVKKVRLNANYNVNVPRILHVPEFNPGGQKPWNWQEKACFSISGLTGKGMTK